VPYTASKGISISLPADLKKAQTFPTGDKIKSHFIKLIMDVQLNKLDMLENFEFT